MPEEVDDTPELPQEMLDLIMSFLRDDSAALKCCSLVCKAWCWSAQSYLFRDLVVLDRNKDPALKMPVSASPYYNVTHYVRGFHVQGVQFDNVPYISQIRLFFSQLHAHPPTPFPMPFRRPRFPCSYHPNVPVYTGPPLGKRALDKNGTASLASRESWSPSALTHLGLKDIRIAPFLRWLTLSTKPLFITHLKFDPIKPEDLPIICHLCSRVNKSVTFLQICLAMEDGLISYLPCQVSHELQSLATSSHIARLYSNTFNIPNYKSRPTLVQLVTLRVDRFMDSTNEIDKQSNSLSWTARILSKVDAPDTFKYLILQMVISRTGQLDECRVTRWDFFDEALGGDIFVNFQYLEFEMVGKVDMEGVTSLLSRRLPKLAQRGRLRFTNVI